MGADSRRDMKLRFPVSPTNPKQIIEEDTDCGEVVFKNDKLPRRAGEHELHLIPPYDSKNDDG